MSRAPKVSRLQVTQQPEHYKEQDGIKYFVGPFTVDQHKSYMEIQKSLYETLHPVSKAGQSRLSAKNKWRNMVLHAIQPAPGAETGEQPRA